MRFKTLKIIVSLTSLTLVLLSCNKSDTVVKDDCKGGVFEGNIFLNSQKEVEQFAAFCYESINGDLDIGGGNITDLSMLNKLTNITGSVDIYAAPMLKSLEGLHNIKSIQHLKIEYMDALTTLNGLNGVETIEGRLSIYNCESLINLDGLNSLKKLESMHLISLPKLENIKALGSVSQEQLESGISVYTCSSLITLEGLEFLNKTDHINLADNENLISLKGLESLKQITGTFSIDRCNSLKNLSGLESLISINNHFNVNGCNSLTSLNGINSLNNIGYMYIGYGLDQKNHNESLVDFCALQNLFLNGSYDSNKVYVEGNAYNPTIQDIINGNCKQ